MLLDVLAGARTPPQVRALLPFVAPGLWRESFRKLTELSDGQLRFIGLASIAIGLAGVWLGHQLASGWNQR